MGSAVSCDVTDIGLLAIIKSLCICVAEIAQFDYDYEQTTDGRFDLRPYGPYLPSRRPGRYPYVATTSSTTRLQMTSLIVIISLSLLMLQQAVV